VNVIVDCYSNYAANGAYPDKFLPTWTPQDPDLYRPGDGARPIDVSFLGSARAYPGRKLALGMLAEAGIAVRQGGGQIEGGLAPEDYACIFRQSKITINFAAPALDGPGYQCKGRVIEATLSGALLMEEANPETEKWLTSGVHYAAFTGERDLVAKVRHYLADEEARTEIAAAGAAHARANYTAAAFWRLVLARALPALEWEVSA
ncbi:MAG: glycosyltransferase family 1 protein, partial [Rhodospirillaceae bacterium]|nr:glycosyltransferase family 1 protein [Rhodospirillaceae bacterium]